MNIRDAADGDERVLAEITVRSWQAAYRHILPASLLENMKTDQREAGWREELKAKNWIIFIAEEAGTPIGWIALGKARDPGCGPGVMELFGIYLDPNAWHQGVGRDLLEHGLERIPTEGVREVVLWVFEENHQARAFYERNGFVLEPDSRKLIEIKGSSYPEVRYRRTMPAPTTKDPA